MTDPYSFNHEIDLLESLFEFIIPKYREAHDILVSLLDFEPDRELRIVDLGCGFGDLTRRLVEAFPRAVVFGIDNHSDILERARLKLKESLDQIVLYQRDLNNDAWSHEIQQLHAVVSSFTLDYLSLDRHRRIIKEAYDLLEISGRWVSCEFYRSEDERVNRIFHDLEVSFIKTALKEGRVTREQIDQLGKSSILRQPHYICTVEEKKAWLENIGFKVEIPWRFLNLAIVSGIRTS